MLVLAAAMFLLPAGAALAQAGVKVPRVGVVGEHGPDDPRMVSFGQQMRALGYVEGQNIVIYYRYLYGALDRVPGLISELLGRNVDILVVGGTHAARAAKTQTKTVPIIFALAADPVASGLVPSLSRPDGNATGMSVVLADISGKQLELLKETLPHVERISVLYNPVNPVGALAVDRILEVARALAVQVQVLEVRQPRELIGAFAKLSSWRAGAVLVVSDPMLGNELVQWATLAKTNRVPAIYNRAEFAKAGGLLAFGPNYSDNYRRAASFVDRIPKGAKPHELPVEQPTTFEFLINLRTARAMGVTIPQALLLRADEVIQ